MKNGDVLLFRTRTAELSFSLVLLATLLLLSTRIQLPKKINFMYDKCFVLWKNHVTKIKAGDLKVQYHICGILKKERMLIVLGLLS